jgi:FdhE protein
MALDRLSRWLGGRPETPPDLTAALGDLDRLSSARPDLETPARSLRGVLIAAFTTGVEPKVAAPDPSIEGAWRDGIPAFRRALPHLDPRPIRDRALAIAEALLEDGPAARPLRDAIRRGRVDVSGWASEALAGRPETLAAGSEGQGIDPDLAASVLRFTLLPTLSRLTVAESPSLADTPGDCPWCGSAPILAELRGLEREVRLRCGLCAGDWPGGRLRCPACGEDDHRRLSTRYVEGEGDRYRLALCDSCGSRLKLVGTLARLSPPSLVVADLATIHLDLIDASEPPISSPSAGS